MNVAEYGSNTCNLPSSWFFFGPLKSLLILVHVFVKTLTKYDWIVLFLLFNVFYTVVLAY